MAAQTADTAGDEIGRKGVVVKLGGSLAFAPALTEWLAALAAGGGRAILVPGGGPFANQVRDTQRRRPFDDATAHRMALLAMEQYGLMLCALHPALRPAATRAAIARLRRQGLVPVWLPSAMALGRPEIAESWDVTSDSLAAWLAATLGLRHLVLVKSAPPPEPATAERLAAAGYIDPMLPDLLRRYRIAARCVTVDQATTFGAAMRDGRILGMRILCDLPLGISMSQQGDPGIGMHNLKGPRGVCRE
jgi:5-(aminomethyl)-3-furanmethanol phosphate kinase